MNTIKLNDTTFVVDNYNRTTSFNGENISSNGYCLVLTDNIEALNDIAEGTITSIQIYHDNELIYNLSDISAHIDTINEYLSTDRIYVNVNLTFDMN